MLLSFEKDTSDFSTSGFLDLCLNSSVPWNLKWPHKHVQFCSRKGETIISVLSTKEEMECSAGRSFSVIAVQSS